MRDVGVLSLVPDQWSPFWQPRHHLLSRLARYFTVVWVNPAPDLRKLVRERFQVAAGSEATDSLPADLLIYRPEFWLPQIYGPEWLASATFRLRFRRALNLLLRRGCKKIVLHIWRPEFAEALRYRTFDCSCYHIDDEYSFSPVEIPLSDREAGIIREVDQVFVHSPALLEKKGWINPHTVFIPNGVDFRLYSQPAAEPSDLASIPAPRIGYTGFVKKQLDWSLLSTIAARHPEWSFVFVGKHSPHPELAEAVRVLRRRSNVYFLGAKTWRDLSRYPQHFDVCIMPYVKNDYTKYIFPLKLNEYLASGRPVVGTPIRSLLEFATVVELADTCDAWSAAVKKALSPTANTPACRAQRQAIAKTYDWDLLAQKVARIVAGRLGPSYFERFTQVENAARSERQ